MKCDPEIIDHDGWTRRQDDAEFFAQGLCHVVLTAGMIWQRSRISPSATSSGFSRLLNTQRRQAGEILAVCSRRS